MEKQMKGNKTTVVYSCGHAKPDVPNDRFSILGKFLYDLKPDNVIDLGDMGDMASLNSYDTRRPEAIVAQNYEKDINSYNDAQERIRWEFAKHRKKKPVFYGFEGNHETRIKTAISHDPRLHGQSYGISFSHLNTNKWYDRYVEYENGAPGILDVDGVDYAHFIGSGNYGNAISGDNHAKGILLKRLKSTTVGHSHKRNIFFKDDGRAIGCVVGCVKGAPESWAGQSNKEWWSGVVIKRNVENGMYDPEFVSLSRLEKIYG
jgi:hypothetical protein